MLNYEDHNEEDVKKVERRRENRKLREDLEKQNKKLVENNLQWIKRVTELMLNVQKYKTLVEDE